MKKYSNPDKLGFFGKHGGIFVAETLIPALYELDRVYENVFNDKAFWDEYANLIKNYVGGPSPVYYAKRFSDYLGSAKIYFKREDLNHTGSHKINNTIGQTLLAKIMGKSRVIAETGAGQHGVATATVAAMFGLKCTIFMGKRDIHRQSANVFRMKLLGAEVIPVSNGSQTLKDALNEALRDWVATVDDTFYIIGTAAGPHPYPKIVRDFQSIIGREAKKQIKEFTNRDPDYVVACIGGGSNAIGLFHPFLEDEKIKLIAVEAGGEGLNTQKHSATISSNSDIGVLHGFKSYLMQDADGQILATHSISAGLDYPGIGPEHGFLHDIGRVKYDSITDDEVINAFKILCKLEGIIPALESSHAVAWVIKNSNSFTKDNIVLVNISGRGDKDINTVANILGVKL